MRIWNSYKIPQTITISCSWYHISVLVVCADSEGIFINWSVSYAAKPCISPDAITKKNQLDIEYQFKKSMLPMNVKDILKYTHWGYIDQTSVTDYWAYVQLVVHWNCKSWWFQRHLGSTDHILMEEYTKHHMEFVTLSCDTVSQHLKRHKWW